jgi:hypothetical protein
MRKRNVSAALPALFSLLSVIAFPGSSVAAEKDYPLCTVGGYFSGSGDIFLSELARNIVQKRNIFGDPICNAAWKNGYKAGENFSKTGKSANHAEQFVFQQAAEFRAQASDL